MTKEKEIEIEQKPKRMTLAEKKAWRRENGRRKKIEAVEEENVFVPEQEVEKEPEVESEIEPVEEVDDQEQ